MNFSIFFVNENHQLPIFTGAGDAIGAATCSARSSLPPAASSRCWSRPHASLGTLACPSVPPPRGAWALGQHHLNPGRATRYQKGSTPTATTPHLNCLTNPNTHCTRTHDFWPLSPRRPSPARPCYPPTSSDTIDQAPPP